MRTKFGGKMMWSW